MLYIYLNENFQEYFLLLVLNFWDVIINLFNQKILFSNQIDLYQNLLVNEVNFSSIDSAYLKDLMFGTHL